MPSDLPPSPTSARTSAPSLDPMLVAALGAVGPAFDAWRSAVAGAADEVRGILSRRGSPAGVATTLGAFAAGRIDLDRFAGLVERGEALDAGALDALRRAASVLSTSGAAPAAEQVVVHVPDGARMRDVVDAAFARLGRTFGAARVAALAQQGRFRPDVDGALLAGLPPRAWTKRERRVAPPLVVSVAGADLDAAALVEVLDGGAKVLLLVRGPSTPAPLVRLLTPGTFVVQTSAATELDGFRRAAGPAVAAVFLDAQDVAAFVHDPAAGPALSDRLVVRKVPTVAVRSPVGGWSSSQQAQELAQLAALAERPAASAAAAAAPREAAPVKAAAPGVASAAPAPGAAGAPAADDPAGRLAAWLLGAVNLGDVRG